MHTLSVGDDKSSLQMHRPIDKAERVVSLDAADAAARVPVRLEVNRESVAATVLRTKSLLGSKR